MILVIITKMYTFKMRIFNLVLIVFLTIFKLSLAEVNCGYKSCHSTKEGHVNIHLVPHTHDNMGWLKTVDQYYYGTKDNIQKAGVRNILSSIVRTLKTNKDRRFIYVETGFFWKWWQEQSTETQNDVKILVNNGQLEFVGAGSSMNDEAVTDYLSTIDQFSVALRKLNETFGECGRAKVGWQIDPFGHSREMASIFAQLGYDGFLLNRIDYQDKAIRMADKSMEFVWRASQSLGNATDIFTNVMYRHYSAPNGLCFDLALCDDDFIVDDPKSVEYNIDSKAESFLTNWVVPASKVYASSNILVPFGDDFMYQYADLYFENLDKLIAYINNRTFNGINYNVIYSTPSCYVKAVYDETGGKLNSPVKTDDFFPYAANQNDFWTGYYSSRPTIKRYARFSNNFVQIAKQLSVHKNFNLDKDEHDLSKLEEALGILQHHDAITGTEKEVVTHDYAKLLYDGIVAAEEVTNAALRILTNTSSNFYTCPLSNISQCSYSENEDTIVVTVYNPLSRSVKKHVRLPISRRSFSVQDSEGNFLDTKIVPIPKNVLNLPGRDSSATNELVFMASDIPALGFKSYYLKKNGSANPNNNGFVKDKSELLDKPKLHVVRSDDDTWSWSYEYGNKIVGFNQTFRYYNGTDAGSYSLKINTSQPEFLFNITYDNFVNGKLVQEFHMTFGDWVSQIVRYYEPPYDWRFLEFEYLVGPIPKDSMGREVVNRFSTELNSKSIFYTDANGRETLKRVRNYRPTWNTTKEPPAPQKNFYPVTSKVVLRDEEKNIEMAVLTDRSQSASSLRDGEIEFLVHRTCEGEGAFEKLNEEAYGVGVVTRGIHRLVMGDFINASGADRIHALEREIAEQLYLDSWVFFSQSSDTFEEYQRRHVMSYSNLNYPLPRNIRIATLRNWGKDTLLLRLEHLFEKDEDPKLSRDVTVNLEDLFASFTITNLRETTLGANQWLEDSDRLKFWSTMDHETFENRKVEDTNKMKIVLQPMQIRTFVLNVKFN